MTTKTEDAVRLAEAVLAARSHIGARRPDPEDEPEDAQQWDDLTTAAELLTQQREAGAVAWRSKMPGDTVWLITAHEPTPPGIVKQPLFLHPAQAASQEAHPAADKVRELTDALESIRQYGSDTISGRVDGPTDREWFKDGVREMTRRARAALSPPANGENDGR